MSSAVPVLTAAEDDGDHPLGMTLGVGRPEHRSPGHPEDDPALDAEVLAQPLDVGDVVVHVDARPVHALLAGVRRAPSGGRWSNSTARCRWDRRIGGPRACSPSPVHRAGTRPACPRGCRPARRRGRDRRRRRVDRRRTGPAAARPWLTLCPTQTVALLEPFCGRRVARGPQVAWRTVRPRIAPSRCPDSAACHDGRIRPASTQPLGNVAVQLADP